MDEKLFIYLALIVLFIVTLSALIPIIHWEIIEIKNRKRECEFWSELWHEAKEQEAKPCCYTVEIDGEKYMIPVSRDTAQSFVEFVNWKEIKERRE